MSDFGSGIERYGPRFELSGRASKADLRRRIAELGEQINADSEGLDEQKARIVELEEENKKAVYGCCEECRALSEAEAENAGFERGARLDRDEIEVLRAEIERLRCCGNCNYWYGNRGSCIGEHFAPCHLTPSRHVLRKMDK